MSNCHINNKLPGPECGGGWCDGVTELHTTLSLSCQFGLNVISAVVYTEEIVKMRIAGQNIQTFMLSLLRS